MPLSDSLLTSMDNFGNTMGMNTTPYGQPASAQDPALRENLVRLAQQAFAEEVRRADEKYALDKQKAKQEYETALSGARTAADVARANARYQDAQAQNARERLAFDRDKEAARLAFDRESTAARLDFDKQTQAQNFGLNQAKLGYDVLGEAAKMRGADDYFQASNYARGVANDPNSSTFLTALKNNVKLPDFGAQYGAPDAYTLGSLSTKLGTPLGAGAAGAGAPGAQSNADAYLRQIHSLGDAGAHTIGAGGLEQLSPDELGLLKSGLEAPLDGKAFNWNTFIDSYKKSRIGQGIGANNAA